MSSPPALSTASSEADSASRRGLTRLQLFMMSFGAIVGVGWITILGQWLSLAGPGGSVIALVAGAAAVLLVAANYALLARKDLLSTGGEIGAVGGSLGLAAAFIVTASLSLASVSIVAFEAVSAGWIVVTIFPALEGPVLYRLFGQDVHAGTVMIALVGTAIVAALNLRPISNTARAQNAIVSVKLGVTALFCVAGLVSGEAKNLLPLLPEPAHGTSALLGVLALVATMPLWYAGFHVIAVLSGERAQSVKLSDVGWVMRTSILAACIFYVCIVLAASYVVPWRTLVSAPLPAAAAFREGLSSVTFANLVLISGLLGICSAWIACFAASVRVLGQLRKQLNGNGHRVREEGAGARARSATIAIAVIAGVLTLAGRPALVPIVNVAAMCFGLVYLLVSIATWRHATSLAERCTVAMGACVAGFMSAYVIVSAVMEGGWMAPEVMVVVLGIFLATVSWLMKPKSMAHAL
jgi:amino acid transporter